MIFVQFSYFLFMRKFWQFIFFSFVFSTLSISLYAISSKGMLHNIGNPSSTLKSEWVDSLVNIHDFGIFGDSTTDYTDQIQKVLNAHNGVYFPPGKYMISRSLVLNDNQIILGKGPASTFLALEGAGATETFAFMKITGKKNISVSNISVELKHVPKFAVMAITAINAVYLKIKKVRAINCGILETRLGRPKHRYGTVPVVDNAEDIDSVSSFFIEIDSCTGIGATNSIAKHTIGVLLRYVNNWEVTNSTLKGYYHGIEWWGGDSNPARDGDTVNIRKSKNGLVRNVIVDRIGGGGIWGSMGENIIVENCRVSNCGDVGIDFEGCYNSQALNNFVENCNNGCLATFHYNKNILFKNNVSIQDNPKHSLARIYNATQRQDNGKIVFQNNTFTAIKGVGFIDQHGPSRHIEFIKNTLNNVVLNLNFNNNKYILIKDNTVNITRATPYSYLIKAGQTHHNGLLKIEGNQITSTAKQDSSLYAISIYQSDYNSSPTNYLINNKIQGISNQITIEWAGANRGVTTKTHIKSEQPIPNSSLKKVDSGRRPSEVYINGEKQP